MSHETEIKNILKQVDPWPQEDRVALAYQILREMRLQTLQPAPRSTLNSAIGIAATDSAAPDDATVNQWMSENRMRKHG